jgi:putative ABC transport system permease protein
MIARIALASVRQRPAAYAGTFLTTLLALALLVGGGQLLWSVLTAEPAADRFAAADATVAVDRSIALTTVEDKGDELKTKTKSERLTGAPVLPAEVVATVAGTPGVDRVVADHAFPAALDRGGVPVGVPDAATVAHGWASAELAPYPLESGRAPERAGEVVLQDDLGAAAGERVRMTTRTGSVELRVVGTVAGDVPGQAAVFVADDQVAALSGLASPTALAVTASASALDALRELLDGAASVHTGDDKVAADLPGAVPDYIGAISVVGFVLGITGFAAVFVLVGTVSLTVRQRLRELALLRTVGALPRQLARMLRVEAVAVAVVAAVPGLPAGVVVAHLVATRLRDLGAVPPQFTVSVNAVVLVAALGAGVVLSVVAAGLAARRAVRIAPTQALREATGRGRVAWLPRILLAGVLTAGAVAVLGLVPLGGPLGMGMGFVAAALLLCAVAAAGPLVVAPLTAVVSRVAGAGSVTGRLAGAMTRARTDRVVGVAVPLALLFAINATMLLDGDVLTEVTADQQAARTAPAALRVTAMHAPGISLGEAVEVATGAGVTGAAATLPTRVVVDQGGKPEDYPAQGLYATGEPALDLGVTSGDLAGLAGPPHSDDAVAVSAPLAEARGWRVGDRPTFWLPDGTRVELRVAAVYDRWRGFGELVLPARLVADHDPRGLVGALYLRGTPDLPADLAATDAADPRGGAADIGNQQAAWELMVVVSLGFTGIAVATTFALSTAARRREFADLRLAGATPRQVQRMLGRETLVAVTVALVLGCVVCGAFSVAQDGRWRLFADPVRYLSMVGGVGLLGLVAGAVPARLVVRRRSLPVAGG